MSRGLGELQREIKDALTILWNHKQPTRFAEIRWCLLVRHGGEEGDTLEPTLERSMRRALTGLLDRGDVVIVGGRGTSGSPREFANVEDFAALYVRKGGASKSMRSAALRLRISAIWISVQPWVRSAVSAARARRRWMASRRNSTTCATASRQSFRLIWGGTV